MTEFTLKTLEGIVSESAGKTAKKSYTASLLAKGTEKSAKKFGEEAVEAVIAAVSGNREELVKETADTLYHMMVMLKCEGVGLSEVMKELQERTAKSGHEEKASRGS
ncbi:MAG: phosphoribosyl-ATP diphosphatase [Pseudomonadota bacterium]